MYTQLFSNCSIAKWMFLSVHKWMVAQPTRHKKLNSANVRIKMGIVCRHVDPFCVHDHACANLYLPCVVTAGSSHSFILVLGWLSPVTSVVVDTIMSD